MEHKYKMGTVTYIVISVSSKNMAETLDKKVERLIKKDIQETLDNRKEKSC